MADSKRYDGSQWEHSLRKLTTATADIEPTIYTDGTVITAYTIKGNTVQNGTPTPSNPVTVQGVGDKTANIFNKATALANTAVSDSRGNTFSSIGLNASDYINVSGMSKISITDTLSSRWGAFYDTNKVFVSGFNGYGTINVPQNAAYMRITVTDAFLDSCMANNGDTLLPFEPNGYKTPISNGQQTIDIYIGDLPLLKSLDGTALDEISNGTLTRRVDSDGSVLPTPITTQITMPSIPTTQGANSITVDTTVQPSEFTATWTGWHNAGVKEWDGSDWQ